jgi:hypothetical protein
MDPMEGMDMKRPTLVETKECPNCGDSMRFVPFHSVIEEHHLKGLLSGLEFPMIAHRPGWMCPNPHCEYFEPLPLVVPGSGER